MNADINVPQSKSITIVFTVMRLSFLLFNAQRVATEWLRLPGRCSTPFRSYSNSVHALSIGILGISIIVLAVLMFTNSFKKVMFYLYYAFVVMVTLYLAVSSAIIIGNKEACESVTAFSYMVLLTCIAINLAVIFVIVFPFELAMKTINLGGCIIWPVFLFAYQRLLRKDCTMYHLQPGATAFAGIIAWSHLIILLVGYFVFTLLMLTVKTTLSSKIWRSIYLFSIIVLSVCFVLAWLGRISDPRRLTEESPCTYQRFFLRVYQLHGWAEIIAPILFMAFVRLENGDIIRENALKYTWGYPQPFIAPPL